MKALSLWQPWASLLVRGIKRYETRGWYTSHRGPLLVHAAKKIGYGTEDLEEGLRAIGLEQDELVYGALIGAVWLEDVKPSNSVVPGYPESAFGDFGPGRFAWRASAALCFGRAYPLRGRQGLFDVDLAELEEPLEHDVLAALDAARGARR